jgi:hypothetical protein
LNRRLGKPMKRKRANHRLDLSNWRAVNERTFQVFRAPESTAANSTKPPTKK